MIEDNYEPFGKEWEKEVMKMNKQDIIALYRQQAMQRKQLEAAMKVIKLELEHQDYRSAARALNVSRVSLNEINKQ